MIQVLSLGAGVQSTTVLRMSIAGELPKLDHAIFADTGWEPAEVYAHLDTLKKECADAGIEFHLVTAGNIREDAMRSRVRGIEDGTGMRAISMPLRTKDAAGGEGLVRRQCTREYKIDPIERCLRQDILGLKPRQRAPRHPVIDQWFGISVDELYRVRPNDKRKPWLNFVYPLVDMKPMSRGSCLAWAERNEWTAPPRSACIGCPYRSNAEWRDLQTDAPEEFADAVAFDEAMRGKGGERGDLFIHRNCEPLKDVDLRTDDERNGQISLWNEECEGMCGV